MNNPHKHAALIKAWADGAKIEILTTYGFWSNVDTPRWDPAAEYRIKPDPHKWQHLIDAQKAGADIQARLPGGEWGGSVVAGGWRFDDPDMEYRIKPPSIRYRLALMRRIIDGGTYTAIVNGEEDHDYVQKMGVFIRWLGDWVEVEV